MRARAGPKVADQLLALAMESGIDGFNITPTYTPRSFAEVVDLVVPLLQERGVFRVQNRVCVLSPCLTEATQTAPAKGRRRRNGDRSVVPRLCPLQAVERSEVALEPGDVLVVAPYNARVAALRQALARGVQARTLSGRTAAALRRRDVSLVSGHGRVPLG